MALVKLNVDVKMVHHVIKMMEHAHALMDFLTQHVVKHVTVRIMRYVQKIQEIVQMIVQWVILDQLVKEYVTVKMESVVHQMEVVTVRVLTMVPNVKTYADV